MKLIAATAIAFALSGCANIALTTNQTRAYLDACVAFGGAANEATNALATGNINIAQATTIDAIIEPIAPLCSGAMPSDLVGVTAKIVDATNTLAKELAP